MLSQLEHWVQATSNRTAGPSSLLQPDLTIWFDLPAQVAAQRLTTARVPDRFEAQPQTFFEQVSAGYARRFAAAPARFARVNANQTPAEVWAEVHSAMVRTGWLA